MVFAFHPCEIDECIKRKSVVNAIEHFSNCQKLRSTKTNFESEFASFLKELSILRVLCLWDEEKESAYEPEDKNVSEFLRLVTSVPEELTIESKSELLNLFPIAINLLWSW